VKKVTLGGVEYTLSALPLIGLSAIGKNLDLIGDNNSADGVQALIDGIWYGIKRNHPDVPREIVEWNIDTHNYKDILEAFTLVNKTKDRGASGKPPARKSTGS